MRHTKLLALVLGSLLLAAGVGTTAGEVNPLFAETMGGFRGFLVGELTDTNDESVIILVRAVTLVQGNKAVGPGAVIGKKVPVRFATERDEEGRERPIPALVRAAKHIGKMPAIAFGGLDGPAVVVIGEGGGGVVNVRQHRVQMRVNGMNIQFDGEPEADAPPEEEPKGPLFTARVLAGDDGVLVMDRLMPGSSPAHTWTGMPIVHFEEAGAERVGEHVHGAAAAQRAQAAEFDRAHAAAARAAAARERALGIDAQARDIEAKRQATIAQIRATTQAVVLLKKLLEQGDHLAPKQVAKVREQIAALEAQTAALEEQMAALGKRAAMLRHAHGHARPRPEDAPKLEPPPRQPDVTDF